MASRIKKLKVTLHGRTIMYVTQTKNGVVAGFPIAGRKEHLTFLPGTNYALGIHATNEETRNHKHILDLLSKSEVQNLIQNIKVLEPMIIRVLKNVQHVSTDGLKNKRLIPFPFSPDEETHSKTKIRGNIASIELSNRLCVFRPSEIEKQNTNAFWVFGKNQAFWQVEGLLLKEGKSLRYISVEILKKFYDILQTISISMKIKKRRKKKMAEIIRPKDLEIMRISNKEMNALEEEKIDFNQGVGTKKILLFSAFFANLYPRITPLLNKIRQNS